MQDSAARNQDVGNDAAGSRDALGLERPNSAAHTLPSQYVPMGGRTCGASIPIDRAYWAAWRWAYTGDLHAPDDVERAARIASNNDLVENSPIRGVFVFAGVEGHRGIGSGEGLGIVGYDVDKGAS